MFELIAHIIFILVSLSIISLGVELDKSNCFNRLLDNRTLVPDSAFSATTQSPSYNASSARESFDSDSGYYAWCPGHLKANDTKEYLQINLNKVYAIKALRTKGRSAMGSGIQYMPFYQIRYKRENSSRWIIYKNFEGKDRFTGNSDALLETIANLQPSIIARYFRLYPITHDEKISVCVKIELFGCEYTDALMEYRMVQPLVDQSDAFSDVKYIDTAYDGDVLSNGTRINGLGRLADYVSASEVENSFSSSNHYYVGWKRSSPRQKFVKIIFRFENNRIFHTVNFKVANILNKARYFVRLEARISVGGRVFPDNTLVAKNFLPDDRLSNIRWMGMDLEYKKGRYIEMLIFFGGDLLLISEVRFMSSPVHFNLPTEPPIVPSERFPEATPMPTTLSTLGIGILGCFCFLMALIIIITLIVLCRRKRRRDRHRSDHRSPSSQIVKTSDGLLQIDLSDPHQPMMTVNGKIVNDSVYTSLPGSDTDTSYAIAPPPPPPPNRYPEDFPYIPNSTVQHRALPNHPISDRNGGLTQPEYASATLLKPGMTPLTGCRPPQITCNPMLDYLDLQQSQLHYLQSTGMMPPPSHFRGPPGMMGMPPPQPGTMNPRTTQCTGIYAGVPQSYYSTQQQAYFSIQGVAGNSTYISFAMDQEDGKQPPVVMRSRLAFMEKLGGGHFGEVHLAEMRISDSSTSGSKRSALPHTNGLSNGSHSDDVEDSGSEDNLNCHLDDNQSGTSSDNQEIALVAVKMLRADSPEQAKRELEREIRLAARINHPHVSSLVGICRDSGPLCALVEYSRFGDLHQFLQAHYSAEVFTNVHPLPPNTRTLSYGALIYMSAQVAAGMAYLESVKIVHRDLACRNCLVGHLYEIKIADLGMCRRLYSTDYCRVEGKTLLPIRWMAWESILKSQFTSKSDVWSFAVTLWEILTFCREQPFQRLSDEQIMFNSGLQATEDTRAEYLQCPPSCPKETFDLMLSCWQRVDNSRPSFREIQMFLQRKNVGYNPQQEPALNNPSSNSTIAPTGAVVTLSNSSPVCSGGGGSSN